MHANETAMPSEQQRRQYTYFAFISYKHEDEKWAKWLQRRLQTYRLPSKTRKVYRDLPKSCSPVFLDKSNLRPGILHQELSMEVQSSKYLIVICSRAAHDDSFYLDQEIRYFLDGGGDRSRIIPFIIDNDTSPEENCFPAALQELCAEDTILGANVHEKGRRNALLKIIAAMHSLKVEELISWDDQRRRRNRILTTAAAVVCLTVLGIGAFKWWDYYVPKEYYYKNYTTRNGIAEGVGELTKKQIKSRETHYTLVYRRGLLQELRAENAFGELTGTEYEMQNDPERNASRSVYSYSQDNKLLSISFYDQFNNGTMVWKYNKLNTIDFQTFEQEEDASDVFFLSSNTSAKELNLGYASDEEEERSKIVRYLVEYDDQGYVTEIHYISDPVYNTAAADADGIFGMRYERNPQGLPTKIVFLRYTGDDGSSDSKDDYEPAAAHNGVSAVLLAYEDNQIVEEWFESIDGETIIGTKGFAKEVLAYDNNGNVREWQYYDTHDRPLMADDCNCAKVNGEYSFDAHGYTVKQTFSDIDGAVCLNAWGYASCVMTFDEHGRCIRFDCFDTDEKPIICKEGYAGIRYEYDEKGRTTKWSCFDTENLPTLCKDGYACVQTEYSEKEGHTQRSKWFLDTKEKPILRQGGYAGFSTEFDEKNRIIREECFGTDRKPVINMYGYASMTYEYKIEKSGNQIRFETLDTHGDPIISAFGYAGWVRQTDDRGRITMQSYFDSHGELMVQEEGYAGFKREYYDSENMNTVTYFGKDEKPVLTTDCYAMAAYWYNAQGSIVEESYYDTNGDPTACKQGYAVKTMGYDDRGYCNKVFFWDVNGEPTICEEGVAAYATEFDNAGRMVSREYYDEKGDLTYNSSGYASVSIKYDAKGNKVEQSYFGPDGTYSIQSDDYASVIRCEYDIRGNRTKEIHLGPDLKLSPNPKHGYAAGIAEYDERDRRIKLTVIDENGNPVNTSDGYAVRTSEFDARDNCIANHFFTADGEPCKLIPATTAYEYDAVGNCTKESNYDEKGALTLSSDGVAVIEYAYDARGREVETVYKGTQNEPILYYGRYACVAAEYNDRGEVIRYDYFGTDGKPVLVEGWGFASVTYTYTERGKTEKTEYLDAGGDPVMTADGYASCINQYGEGGSLTVTEFYDTDGKQIGTRQYQYVCYAAKELSAYRNDLQIREVYVIVRLGDWHYAQVISDGDLMQTLFVNEVNRSSLTPLPLLYLQYDASSGKYVLHSAEFVRGKMGWRVFDMMIEESDLVQIENAIRTQMPQEEMP